MKFKTIDLCAGIGGIRRGFELTGYFENVLSAENDRFACMTYSCLFGDDAFNDLTTDEFKDLVDQTEYDVLLAGFPCQAFSRAGLELGFEDTTKGTIFYHIAEIVQRTRPRAVFLENVDNLVRHDKGNTFRIIIETLENELNYKVIGVTRGIDEEIHYRPRDFIRNSRYFGIPQNRPRTYIMAFDRQRYGGEQLNCIENYLPEGNDLHLYDDLNDLLELGAEAKHYMSSQYLQTLEKHIVREKAKGHGFGYRIVNAPGIEHPVANTIMATGGSGKERNLVYDPQEGIAGTIIATKKTPVNDKGIRVMTPREWGKLQGFINYAFIVDGTDRFSFPDGVTAHQQYKQFGNSVTIPVIQTMAEYMVNCFRMLGELPNI